MRRERDWLAAVDCSALITPTTRSSAATGTATIRAPAVDIDHLVSESLHRGQVSPVGAPAYDEGALAVVEGQEDPVLVGRQLYRVAKRARG